jgi:hypothetical protein
MIDMELAGQLADTHLVGCPTDEEILLCVKGTAMALRYCQGRGISFYLATQVLTKDLSYLMEIAKRDGISLKKVNECLTE